MPLYADLAAMQARFDSRDLIELSDAAGTGALVPERIDQSLIVADNLIRGYVAARHKQVEALAGNPLLTDIACDLAFADLWRSDLPEWVKDKRKTALSKLADISAGKIKLDSGEEEAAPRPGAIHISSAPQRFGRDRLEGY